VTDFFFLVPIALALGLVGLGAFMWALKSGQYEDLDGAAERILFDDDDGPVQSNAPTQATSPSLPPPSGHGRGVDPAKTSRRAMV
jgi:cbb3-type cytochrome oxidase maturation protein